MRRLRFVNKTPVAPEKPPLLREAIFMVESAAGIWAEKVMASPAFKYFGVACNVCIWLLKCMLSLRKNIMILCNPAPDYPRC